MDELKPVPKVLKQKKLKIEIIYLIFRLLQYKALKSIHCPMKDLKKNLKELVKSLTKY
jgi:hypothetical protein